MWCPAPGRKEFGLGFQFAKCLNTETKENVAETSSDAIFVADAELSSEMSSELSLSSWFSASGSYVTRVWPDRTVLARSEWSMSGMQWPHATRVLVLSTFDVFRSMWRGCRRRREGNQTSSAFLPSPPSTSHVAPFLFWLVPHPAWYLLALPLKTASLLSAPSFHLFFYLNVSAGRLASCRSGEGSSHTPERNEQHKPTILVIRW